MTDLTSENLERLLLLRQRSNVTTAFLSVQIAQEEKRLMEEAGVSENEIAYKGLEVKANLSHYRNLCHISGIESSL